MEVELKFQLPPARRAALERALATRSAVRQRLRALYFDTADGRLAAAQLALRLRQEDAQWVQTLKGRGDGLMQRLEDEVPLDRPPAAGKLLPDPARHEGTAAGRTLARALAGAPPLLLQYGTDIRRLKRVLRHDGARVEVALDIGHLHAGERRAEVCEVEFELLAGPPQALLSLAATWAGRYGLVLDVTTKAERGQRLAAGVEAAPVVRGSALALGADATVAQARAAMVGAALAQALPNAAALVNGQGGPDHVHQLRVALRRLRTVLRAFGPPDADRDAAMQALFGALGARRDADVRAVTLAPALAAAAAAGLPAPPPVTDVAAPGDGAADALRAPGVVALWLALLRLAVDDDAALAPGDDAPWAPAAMAVLRRWRRAARHLAADWDGLDDPARHRLRKRLKRLRYLLEFCAPVLPARRLARQLDALRPLQDLLGQWNDSGLARAWLAGQPDSPSGDFAAGWLARDAQAVDRACARAARAWHRLPRPRLSRRATT